MELERRLKKVARYHLALFLLPLLSLLYYGWWSADVLDQRPDNPLRLSPMARRGKILDRHGEPLAESTGERRLYPLGSAAGPLIGYHLRGRNQSGLEALLQTELSPPAPPKSLWGALQMDREKQQGVPPLQGSSVSLTLDSHLQSSLQALLEPRAGAIVVSDEATGEILAAVSGPSFDPGDIARDWQELRADPRSPLIERVGSGLYPVAFPDGSSLLPPEHSKEHAWLGDNPFPGYPGASSAVELDGTVLVSPLMLLSMAAGEGQVPTAGSPRLLRNPSQDTVGPATAPPTPGPGQEEAGARVYPLLGPEFRDSPAFQVLLGRVEAERPLLFAAVLEDASPQQMTAVKGRLLSLLSSWREGPVGSR